MEEQNEKNTGKQGKKLLGLYRLPSASEWNEEMTEKQRVDLVESILEKITSQIQEETDNG